MNLTAQQTAICEAALHTAPTGGRVKIVAGAGTGKTATLLAVASVLRRADPSARMLYLAYSRPIMLEARAKFAGLAEISTLHGLAYRALGVQALRERIGAIYPAHVLRAIDIPEHRYGLTQSQLARGMLQTLRAFCNVPALTPNAECVPARLHETLGASGINWMGEQTWALLQALSPLNPKRTKLPLSHEVYLKIWQLSGSPGLAQYTSLLFDEAQDANPLIVDTLAQARHAIFVGDSHQQIYQFRGAVDAMRALPGEEWPLTQSFRWGDDIAAVANRVLAMKSLPPKYPLSGNQALRTRIGPVNTSLPHARIYRTNSALVQDALTMQDLGRDPAIVGDRRDFVALLRAVAQLRRNSHGSGRPAHHPAIDPYASWDDLIDAMARDTDVPVDIRTAVATVKDHGARLEELLTILERSGNGHRVMLTTAHKAKGLEWEQSVVLDDFDRVLARAGIAERDNELNLLYVAVTRARTQLEVQSPYVRELVGLLP